MEVVAVAGLMAVAEEAWVPPSLGQMLAWELEGLPLWGQVEGMISQQLVLETEVSNDHPGWDAKEAAGRIYLILRES